MPTLPLIGRRLAPLVLAVVALGAATVPPDRYELAPESRFWIDGTATTGPWTCEADDVSGSGTIGGRDLAAEVAVPVRAFDCGVGPMNRDLRRALRAEAHPAIEFSLERAEALDAEPRPGDWVRVRAVGTLRLAGTDRRITVLAEGRRRPDGRVDLRGEQPLRMSDFGVRPPSHALGLVRAHDPITVRFDLTAVSR